MVVLLLNIGLAVFGLLGALAAFGGETWLKEDLTFWKRITRRGWISLSCLLFAFGLAVTKELVTKSRSEHQDAVIEDQRTRLNSQLLRLDSLQNSHSMAILEASRIQLVSLDSITVSQRANLSSLNHISDSMLRHFNVLASDLLVTLARQETLQTEIDKSIQMQESLQSEVARSNNPLAFGQLRLDYDLSWDPETPVFQDYFERVRREAERCKPDSRSPATTDAISSGIYKAVHILDDTVSVILYEWNFDSNQYIATLAQIRPSSQFYPDGGRANELHAAALLGISDCGLMLYASDSDTSASADLGFDSHACARPVFEALTQHRIDELNVHPCSDSSSIWLTISFWPVKGITQLVRGVTCTNMRFQSGRIQSILDLRNGTLVFEVESPDIPGKSRKLGGWSYRARAWEDSGKHPPPSVFLHGLQVYFGEDRVTDVWVGPYELSRGQTSFKGTFVLSDEAFPPTTHSRIFRVDSSGNAEHPSSKR